MISTYMSKDSFQYGFRVFLITLVVCVCSASTVRTANGSGSLNTSRFDRPSAATTGLMKDQVLIHHSRQALKQMLLTCDPDPLFSRSKQGMKILISKRLDRHSQWTRRNRHS